MEENSKQFNFLLVAFLVLVFLLLPANAEKMKEDGLIPQEIIENAAFQQVMKYRQDEKSFWSNRTVSALAEQNNQDSNASIEALPIEQVEQVMITTIMPTATITPTVTVYVPLPQAEKRILMLGDSMMLVGFGPQLEAKLRSYKQVTTAKEGKYSTGLNRTDYYDWFKQTEKLLRTFRPNVMVVMYGANDGQGIRDSKGVMHKLTSAYWDEVYEQRVRRYLDIVSPKVERVYWVGHPISKTPDFYGKFLRMNKIYSRVAKDYPNVEYIDAWNRFAIKGRYSDIIKNDAGSTQVARHSDGVHVTNFGGEILAALVIKNMNELGLQKK